MEGPISKFIHVQQQDSFWPASTPFKSPDLIELNSDSERNVVNGRTVDPLNYSSSQDEVETEDDGNDAPESAILGKDGVYDVTSHDEESCHLLQTEDDSENSDSEHAHDELKSSSDSHCSGTSNGGSSASENGPNGTNPAIPDHVSYEAFPYTKIWSMSPEQREYYNQQFLQLQPDPNGLISGEVAKPFFEKSRLPLEDLRNIWQLADITEDGWLDLNEFRIAMHFVVVRKHGLPIPSDYYDHFGDSRRNSLIQHAREQEHAKARLVTNGSSSGSTPAAATNGVLVTNGIQTVVDETQLEQLHISKVSPTRNSAFASCSKQLMCNPTAVVLPSTSRQKVSGHREKLNLREIQRPSKEEWTTFDNEPVNFSTVCDTSGLVAPVPVRLTTPEENLIITHPNNACASASKVHHLQLKSIQRPKLSGQHPKSIGTGTIAPPPPPRRKTHVRSSSLDLNRLTISSELHSSTNGAELPGRSFLSPSHQGRGAFSVYRKPLVVKSETIPEPMNELNDFRKFRLSIENTVDELRNDVTELRNDNIILTKITSQLLEQLSTLQTRRTHLTFQLHQISSDSIPPSGNSQQS